jgi:hypothetical protein
MLTPLTGKEYVILLRPLLSREREKRNLGRGVVRDTTVLEGGLIETEFGSFEGS